MNNNEFYDVIDNEIQQIVDVNKDNPELQKKNLRRKGAGYEKSSGDYR